LAKKKTVTKKAARRPGGATQGKRPVAKKPAPKRKARAISNKQLPITNAPAATHVAKAHAYARDVVAGRIVAGKLIIKACQRHLDDLARAGLPAVGSAKAGFPWVFDEARAVRPCKFMELLPHVKGKWARRDPLKPGANRLKLEPWQCFLICSLFGWVHPVTGLRRFKEADIWVARKNAKSTLAAGIGWWMFAKDGEPGAEVYCGASSEKQAWEVFGPARQLAIAEPELPQQLNVEVNAKSLILQAGGNLSKFAPVIGKPGDGASPNCAIIDEYHEHQTSEQFDTFKTGMGAREQPLLLVISTAGFNIAGPARDRWREGEAILNRTFDDERRFVLIYTLDSEDEWTTEAGLMKANPNWGVSVNRDTVLADQVAAMREARNQTAFKTKHCNLWVNASTAFFNLEYWNQCKGEKLTRDAFTARPCFLGGDLASKVDLAALAYCFPGDDGTYDLFARYYCPAAQVQLSHNQHYQKWAREGWLTVTPGDMIDLEQIRDDIMADHGRHDVREVPLDPWQALMLINQLRAAGGNAFEFRQTVQNMSEPMKNLDALMRAKKLRHDGNPITTWCLSNVVAHTDAKDNVYPRKEKDVLKIDGAVATIMALARAMTAPAPAAIPSFAFV
jgi:phage terminase large subunit-like protein